MRLAHGPIELIVLHEFLKVELVGSEVVGEDFEVGHAFELGLVSYLFADEGAKVVNNARGGEFACC